jgi:hypothetical protein
MARKLYGMLSEPDYSVGGSMQWNNSLERLPVPECNPGLIHLRPSDLRRILLGHLPAPCVHRRYEDASAQAQGHVLDLRLWGS